MAFRAEQYYHTALERLQQSYALYDRADSYALAMYVAGLAVECLLRAFKLRRDPVFDERHDLLLLFKASGMLEVDEKRIKERGVSRREALDYVSDLRATVNDVYILWSNDYRYFSEKFMRTQLAKKKLPGLRKGDVVKGGARRLIQAAQKLVDKGVLLWTYSTK